MRVRLGSTAPRPQFSDSKAANRDRDAVVQLADQPGTRATRPRPRHFSVCRKSRELGEHFPGARDVEEDVFWRAGPRRRRPSIFFFKQRVRVPSEQLVARPLASPRPVDAGAAYKTSRWRARVRTRSGGRRRERRCGGRGTAAPVKKKACRAAAATSTSAPRGPPPGRPEVRIRPRYPLVPSAKIVRGPGFGRLRMTLKGAFGWATLHDLAKAFEFGGCNVTTTVVPRGETEGWPSEVTLLA